MHKQQEHSVNNIAIRVNNLSKCYQLYNQPSDRLKQFLWRGRRQYFREFWALRDVSFEVGKGEVLGIIGRNGAGKSTLLQLLCGTLTPTSGSVEVNGRIAALLELGAGFNPEFTGRENVFMSAAILGLSPKEIEEHYEEIVDFSGIRDFIDQPVKTYSSGMYVRLAFSVATSVDPDILIVDEALSVGDGEFARKSFDRIRAMKEAGKTILFCSHSLYQVEAFCNRAIWLNEGKIEQIGTPAQAVVAYNNYVSHSQINAASIANSSTEILSSGAPQGTAKIVNVSASCDGFKGKELLVRSRFSELVIEINYAFDPSLPCPSVAVLISDLDERKITSAGTTNERLVLTPSSEGAGYISVTFENIALLKGQYWLYAFLMCEKGIHIYEMAGMFTKLIVIQDDLEVGIVSLPHTWNEHHLTL
jgi:lipopolysaccharide transport system ATP-binding protein